jgi:predicted secreted acid phosphatase
MIARFAAVVSAAALLFSPIAGAEPPAPPSPIVPPPVQPPNIGDLKNLATQYYDSGAYLTDLQQAAWPAIPWITEEAPRVERPAVVLDVDETSLSNWEAIKANDFGRVGAGPCDQLPEGPCGWRAWGRSAQATVIQPTLDVFNATKDSGAATFFITGRGERQRAATERNLAAVGYTGYTRLIMEPAHAQYVSAADFKAPQRQAIEQEGYTIIANLGDQPSDLAGGFAERTFQLPNPFYRIP